ncbi:MAG TPA: hypothetical protein DDX54_05605 [Rhodospirillaceae bacterium]|nr:hypothetical protein [Rhodospirillaceae bacterium]
MQSAQEAEPDFERCRDQCNAWQGGDHRDEVGFTSLPLPEGVEIDGVSYTHVICRTYFAWATAGRVSRSGHAVLLTKEQWKGLDYNPDNLPHLVENAGAFKNWDFDFQRFDRAFAQAMRRDVTPGQGSKTLPLRLPADAPPAEYAKALRSLPPEQRARASCTCGALKLRREHRQRVDLAPQEGDLPPSSEALPFPPVNREPDLTGTRRIQTFGDEPRTETQGHTTHRGPLAKFARSAASGLGGGIVGTIASWMTGSDASLVGTLGFAVGAYLPSMVQFFRGRLNNKTRSPGHAAEGDLPQSGLD